LGALESQRVLITGAAGFIGSHLTRRLIAEGAHVAACVLNESDQRTLADVAGDVSFYKVDIGDPADVEQAVTRTRPGIIFHLAAVGMSMPCASWQAAVRVNVEGTRNLIEAARQVGVQRFVHTGTAFEHGYPDDVEQMDSLGMYAASKTAASQLVRDSRGLSAVILRLFAVYGPGQSAQSLVPGAVLAALAGRDFATTRGEQGRDFVFIGDVVEGYVRAAIAGGIDGQAIDLGTGVTCSVQELVTRIFELAGSSARPLIGALPYRSGEMMHQVADPRPARELLGWQAGVSLEAGLRQTIEWYRHAADHRH
jgi:nucleoside-diphosphate-sugar epimerase